MIGAALSPEGKEGPLKPCPRHPSQHTERFLNSAYIRKRPTFAEHLQQASSNRWEQVSVLVGINHGWRVPDQVVKTIILGAKLSKDLRSTDSSKEHLPEETTKVPELAVFIHQAGNLAYRQQRPIQRQAGMPAQLKWTAGLAPSSHALLGIRGIDKEHRTGNQASSAQSQNTLRCCRSDPVIVGDDN